MTDNVIMVQPMMPGSTKAPIEGTTFPNQAFVMSASYTPTGGSASTYFQGINFSKSGSVWVPSTSKYWPKSSTTAFLAASFPGLSATAYWGSPAASSMTLASSGNANTIPDNRTVQSDIMYAGTGNVTQSSGSVALQFKHAQALLKFTGQAYMAYSSGSNTGVTIESIVINSLKYQGKLGVSMSGSTVTASWTMQNTTGSATAASGSWGLPETGTVNIGSGYLVMPQGAVAITINYTMHKGGSNSSKSYTFTPSGSWAMATAYTYAIFIDQDAVSITATATVDDWSIVDDIRLPVPALFAGFQITPGSLYYQGGHNISSTWNYAGTTWQSLNRDGSTLFLWSNVSYLASPGISFDDYDGWRIPSKGEWDAIVGTTRNGSTVNGSTNKHYAYIQVTGVSYGDYANPYGLLLFPDNRTLTGPPLNNMDNMTANTLTNDALDVYLEQGCVFLEAGGGRGSTSNYGRGTQGVYLSSSSRAGNPIVLKFSTGTLHTNDHLNETVGEGGTVRLVRTY